MTTESTDNNLAILSDPAFKTLMSKRSRLRWGLTTFLSVAYLGYGLAGVYLPDVMARPFFGSSMPWVMFIGYLLIALSIVLSIGYIHIVNSLILEHDSGVEVTD